MSQQPDHSEQVEQVWRSFLSSGHVEKEHRQRRFFRILPASHRCKFCKAPFEGVAAPAVRLFFGKRPSNLNPRFCNVCEEFARSHQGGAEVELSLLFADVRGSTTLAEKLTASEFRGLINRFYKAATAVLIQSDALIDKLVGDQVIGIFVPGFVGPDHARAAVEAAQKLLSATGHAGPQGRWVQVGAGVHTGPAFFGAVGSGSGVFDITALGDAVNTAARLSSLAGPGEVIVSEQASLAARLDTTGLEQRLLQLKGRTDPVNAHVIQVAAGQD